MVHRATALSAFFMSRELKLSVGQYSDKGRKKTNQDFYGVCTPKEPQLTSKGIAIAIADGISSSSVSHMASQAAVTALLDEYFCTSDSWTVKTAVERVLVATNSWLHAQTQQGQGRFDKDQGYVCTLSAMVVKGRTAHLFHVGDTRIYQLHSNKLEQLTTDHRVQVSSEQSYLGRALGIDSQIEIDYQAIPIEHGDVFLLLTDGVYEHIDANAAAAALDGLEEDLDRAAKNLVEAAYHNGSNDNLTAQIIRVDRLPGPQVSDLAQQVATLPLPPILQPREQFDGYTVVRELHASCRSHVYLVVDNDTGTQLVLKAPSVEMAEDPAHLERFLMEEWIARRLNSAHVLKPCPQARQRNYLYVVMEFVDGLTLGQWMVDHPRPDLNTVRGIVEQISKGLRAFHKMEMLHQDLKPENIMIDSHGTVKIVDFGSTLVAGVLESGSGVDSNVLGTLQYTAPEYFIGDSPSIRSDLYALGVIAYQMLSGNLPYGMQAAKVKTKAHQRALQYRSLVDDKSRVPAWIDDAIRKATHPMPHNRHGDVAEFVYDLWHPHRESVRRRRPPLIERNPLIFWKCVSLLLLLTLVFVLGAQASTS